MSRDENDNDIVSDDTKAFEYVLGSLKGAERQKFEQQMQELESVRYAVQFWEEQLMYMQDSKELPPKEETWSAIYAKINPTVRTSSDENSGKQPWWKALALWKTSTAALAMLWVLTIGWFSMGINTATVPTDLNSDYVAILNDEEGQPILTALTSSDGKTLWLKWEEIEIEPDTSLQLWAQSRRDGEIRPLVIFEAEKNRELVLNETNWRLIKDSAYLLLTEEEPGGSAIDEPSEELIAKGVCIRLVEKQETKS